VFRSAAAARPASYYREFGGSRRRGDRQIRLHHTTPDLSAGIIIKYSKLERVPSVDQIEHRSSAEALKLVGVTDPHLELTSMADIPAHWTRLVGQLHDRVAQGVARAQKKSHLPRRTRRAGLRHRDEQLGEPIGKQDNTSRRSAASRLHVSQRRTRRVSALRDSEETLFNLEDNSPVFHRYSRSASAILKDQNDKSKANDKAMLDNMHFTKELGFKSLAALESGNLEEFARLMDVHWQRKKVRSSGMSNAHINDWYDHAMANGALAETHRRRRGGFLMFYAGDKKKLRHAMRERASRKSVSASTSRQQSRRTN